MLYIDQNHWCFCSSSAKSCFIASILLCVPDSFMKADVTTKEFQERKWARRTHSFPDNSSYVIYAIFVSNVRCVLIFCGHKIEKTLPIMLWSTLSSSEMLKHATGKYDSKSLPYVDPVLSPKAQVLVIPFQTKRIDNWESDWKHHFWSHRSGGTETGHWQGH